MMEFSQTRRDSPGQRPADTKAEKGPEANEREQQVPVTAAMDGTTRPPLRPPHGPPRGASLAALRVETGERTRGQHLRRPGCGGRRALGTFPCPPLPPPRPASSAALASSAQPKPDTGTTPFHPSCTGASSVLAPEQFSLSPIPILLSIIPDPSTETLVLVICLPCLRATVHIWVALHTPNPCP